jgi:hypothetical protein
VTLPPVSSAPASYIHELGLRLQKLDEAGSAEEARELIAAQPYDLQELTNLLVSAGYLSDVWADDAEAPEFDPFAVFAQTEPPRVEASFARAKSFDPNSLPGVVEFFLSQIPIVSLESPNLLDAIASVESLINSAESLAHAVAELGFGVHDSALRDELIELAKATMPPKDFRPGNLAHWHSMAASTSEHLNKSISQLRALVSAPRYQETTLTYDTILRAALARAEQLLTNDRNVMIVRGELGMQRDLAILERAVSDLAKAFEHLLALAPELIKPDLELAAAGLSSPTQTPHDARTRIIVARDLDKALSAVIEHFRQTL